MAVSSVFGQNTARFCAKSPPVLALRAGCVYVAGVGLRAGLALRARCGIINIKRRHRQAVAPKRIAVKRNNC